MADDSRAERNEQFFEEYRQKKAQREQLRAKAKELEHESIRLRGHMSSIDFEIDNMRRIITSMIDDGVDPTHAKLVGVDHMNDDMWNNIPSRSYNYPSMSLSIDTLSHSMGAVGAVGASYNSVLTTDNTWTSLHDISVLNNMKSKTNI